MPFSIFGNAYGCGQMVANPFWQDGLPKWQ